MIFPKNFLNLKMNMIEKQGIINLSSDSSKSYASAVLSDSQVAFFFKKGENAAFHPILLCVLFMHNIA